MKNVLQCNFVHCCLRPCVLYRFWEDGSHHDVWRVINAIIEERKCQKFTHFGVDFNRSAVVKVDITSVKLFRLCMGISCPNVILHTHFNQALSMWRTAYPWTWPKSGEQGMLLIPSTLWERSCRWRTSTSYNLPVKQQSTFSKRLIQGGLEVNPQTSSKRTKDKYRHSHLGLIHLSSYLHHLIHNCTTL